MFRLLFLLVASHLSINVISQEIWNGDFVQFQRTPTGSIFDLENQDRISSSVWLTRDNTRGLFNIRQEQEYTNNQSPDDTRWAFAGINGNPIDGFSAKNFQNLNFTNWETALGGRTQLLNNILNRPAVLFLQVENIYVDIEFTSWGANGNGGFTYLRASAPASSVVEELSDEEVPIPFWALGLLGIIFIFVKKCIGNSSRP